MKHSIAFAAIVEITPKQIEECLKVISEIGKNPKLNNNIVVKVVDMAENGGDFNISDCTISCESPKSEEDFCKNFLTIKTRLMDIMGNKMSISYGKGLTLDDIMTLTQAAACSKH
jgi:hypothetical protein